MRRWVALLMVGALAACSGEAGGDGTAGSDEAAATTTTVERTTTTLTPEAAFTADIEANTDGGDPAAMVDIGSAVCELLDSTSTAAMIEDDAANDTPESDAAIAEQNQDMLLGGVLTEIGNDDVGAVIFDATGKHLCPEHAETITSFLASRGLTG